MNFNPNRPDFQAIVSICKRFEAIAARLDIDIGNRTVRFMDLTACHTNGCALDLPALLAAGDSDFTHDVAGITRHINRTTGTLRDGFVPRFAALVTAATPG